MAKNNKPSKMREKINELCEENEYLSIQQNRNRARSITVGTAFGGVPEITLRSDVATVYAQMQPVEVVELIEQLASGIGVEVAMRPKQNFASWRGWEEVVQQRIGFDRVQWKGAAAWQLDSDMLEENYQRRMNLLEEKKVEVKELEPETPKRIYRRKTTKQPKETSNE